MKAWVSRYIDAYTEPYIAPDFDPKEFGESREEYIERSV